MDLNFFLYGHIETPQQAWNRILDLHFAGISLGFYTCNIWESQLKQWQQCKIRLNDKTLEDRNIFHHCSKYWFFRTSTLSCTLIFTIFLRKLIASEMALSRLRWSRWFFSTFFYKIRHIFFNLKIDSYTPNTEIKLRDASTDSLEHRLFKAVHFTCTHGQNFPFGFLGPRNLDPCLHTKSRFSPWPYPATYPDRTHRGALCIWWRRKSRK